MRIRCAFAGHRRGAVSLGVAACLAASGIGLAGAAVAFQYALRSQGVRLQKKPIHPADGRTLGSIPRETAHWTRFGTDRIESKEIEEVLGTSNYISRIYVRKDTPEGSDPDYIDFHAAYYTGMIDTVPHVPEVCLVGNGMQMSANSQTVHLPLDSERWTPDIDVPSSLGEWYRIRTSDGSQRVRLPKNPEGISIRVSQFQQPGDKTLRAGYFFVANGDWVAHAHGVRLLSFRLQEEYAYYMKVQFSSTSYDTNEEFAAASASLLDDLFGDVMLCVPDWVDVKTGVHPDVQSDRRAEEES